MRRLVTLLIILALGAGCASLGRSRPPQTVQVDVSSEGAVSMAGKKLLLTDVPKAIKKTGATSETGIIIAIPENASYTVLKDVTETLATAGYARVMFIKPRQAIGDVKRKP